LKILIISPTQSGIGGIAQNVKGLTNYLKKQGHTVEIISSENTLTIPIRGLKNPSFMISSFLKTKFYKKYDIIHAQNIASSLAMKNVQGKKLLSLWGMFGDQIELLHGKTLGTLSKKFEKNALEWADVITVPSKEMYDFYTNKGYKVEILSNAIDISSLPKNEERLYKKQIIFAGRLSEEKGILDMIEVAKKLPKEINLLVLGSGPEELKIKKLAEKLSNVHYLGYQPKEKVIPLIRGSDILIQPSLMEGGLSTSLLEAMICKVPTITTTAGRNKETLEHLKTAYIIKFNSPDSIIDGINYLFSNEQDRIKLTENAYVLAKNFDWNTIGKRHLEIYEKMLESIN
jgi:glycosyltransferase involved in cell wall biosynthesis